MSATRAQTAGAPAVSVLMPVWNGEAHLEAAIASVLGQTWRDLELVVVDDGSTDGTPALLARLAVQDARLRVLTRPNGGIVAALNAGLAACRGALVARMDADDLCRPERIARQVAAFRDDPALVLCGSAIEMFGDRRGVLRFPTDDRGCRAMLATWSSFAHPSVMMRSDVLQAHGLRYDAGHQYAEDYRLWSDLARFGRLRNLPEPLLRYRVHAGQISQARRQAQQEVHLRVALDNLGALALPRPVGHAELAPVLFAHRASAWSSLRGTLGLTRRCLQQSALADASLRRGVALQLLRRGLRVSARNLVDRWAA